MTRHLIRHLTGGGASWCAAVLVIVLVSRASGQALQFAAPPTAAERAAWAQWLELSPAQRRGLEAVAAALRDREVELGARQDACAARWRAVLGDPSSTTGVVRSLLARRRTLRNERRALDRERFDRAALWLTEDQVARIEIVRRARSRARAAAIIGGRAAPDVVGAVHSGGAAPNPRYDGLVLDAVATWDRAVTASTVRLAVAADALVEDLTDRRDAGADLRGAMEVLRAAQTQHAADVEMADEAFWRAIRAHPDAPRVAAAWLFGGGGVTARDAAFVADPWVERVPALADDVERGDQARADLRTWIDAALVAMRSAAPVAVDDLRGMQDRQRGWIEAAAGADVAHAVCRGPGRWMAWGPEPAVARVIVHERTGEDPVPLALDPRLPPAIRAADVAQWAEWFGTDPALAHDATIALQHAVRAALEDHDLESARRRWFDTGDRAPYDAAITSLRAALERAERVYFTALAEVWPGAPIDLWHAGRARRAIHHEVGAPVERLAVLDVVQLAVTIDASSLRDGAVVERLRAWAGGTPVRVIETDGDRTAALRRTERALDGLAARSGAAAVGDAVVVALWPELRVIAHDRADDDTARAAAVVERATAVAALYDALRALARVAPDDAVRRAAAASRLRRALRHARDVVVARHTIEHGE